MPMKYSPELRWALFEMYEQHLTVKILSPKHENATNCTSFPENDPILMYGSTVYINWMPATESTSNVQLVSNVNDQFGNIDY